jgi:hypothetical protein
MRGPSKKTVIRCIALSGLIALGMGCGSGSSPTDPLPATQPVSAIPTTLPAGGVIDRHLVADYYTGDGLGYNLLLSLREDGTFTCKWLGCLGDYGHATGNWARAGDRVIFVNRDSTDQLKDYLRGATVVDGVEFPAIVLDQEHDSYQKNGLSRFSALQRRTAPSQ